MWGQCDLELELDDRQYQAGDEVTGRVHVSVDKDCECDELTVTAQWYTHGRGTPTSGSEHTTLVVANEDWKPGESHTYPFSILLPNGPCTYRGHYLNVDWSVEADIEISWSFDPEVDKDIVVEPADEPVGEPYRTGDPHSASHQDASTRTGGAGGGAGCVVLLLVPFLLAGIGTTGAGVAMMGDEEGAWMMVAFGLVFTGFPLWIIWKKFLRNKVAEMQLGDVEAGIEDSTVSPGDEVGLEVYIPPESDTELNMVNVGLRGWEKVKYQQGTNTRTRTHEFYNVDDVVDGTIARRLADGESARLETVVEVPETAPYTFHAYRNDIYWAATVHVDIDGWPDWKKEIPVDVVPAVEEEVDGEVGDGDDGGESEEAPEVGSEEPVEPVEEPVEIEDEPEDVEPVW